MADWKEGDIIIWHYGVGIIGEITGNDVDLTYKYQGNIHWSEGTTRRSSLDNSDNGVRLHDDPDAILADYTAWMLTNG